MCETLKELQAHGFGLAQSPLYGHLEIELVDTKLLSLSLYLSVYVCLCHSSFRKIDHKAEILALSPEP